MLALSMLKKLKHQSGKLEKGHHFPETAIKLMETAIKPVETALPAGLSKRIRAILGDRIAMMI